MSEKKRTRPIKKALKILGAAFAVLLIIVGAFFIWLRTSSGSGFVFGQLSKILAEAGYTLTSDRLQGPRRRRIFIRHLTLAGSDRPSCTVGPA